MINRERWSTGMRLVAAYSEQLAEKLGLGRISVYMLNDITASFAACYGDKKLTFNIGRLGYSWFDNGINQRVDALVIHELAHDLASDHLSHEYHDALCSVGAKMKWIALTQPEFFKQFEGVRV
jgi:hypothetical protein